MRRLFRVVVCCASGVCFFVQVSALASHSWLRPSLPIHFQVILPRFCLLMPFHPSLLFSRARRLSLSLFDYPATLSSTQVRDAGSIGWRATTRFTTDGLKAMYPCSEEAERKHTQLRKTSQRVRG